MYYMSIKANMEVEYGTEGIILYQELKGEYAYLKRTDIESEEELFIAMALLPLGVTSAQSYIMNVWNIQ